MTFDLGRRGAHERRDCLITSSSGHREHEQGDDRRHDAKAHCDPLFDTRSRARPRRSGDDEHEPRPDDQRARLAQESGDAEQYPADETDDNWVRASARRPDSDHGQQEVPEQVRPALAAHGVEAERRDDEQSRRGIRDECSLPAEQHDEDDRADQHDGGDDVLDEIHHAERGRMTHCDSQDLAREPTANEAVPVRDVPQRSSVLAQVVAGLGEPFATWNATPIVSAQQMTRSIPRRSPGRTPSGRAGGASAIPADAAAPTREIINDHSAKVCAGTCQFSVRFAFRGTHRPLVGGRSRCRMIEQTFGSLPRVRPWEAWMDEREVVTELMAPEAFATERLEAHLSAAECRWLQLVAEFDRREAWLQWGCRTCAFWLSWKCGLDIRSAQEKLRRRARAGRTASRDRSVRGGSLSYSKVRAISRIATPENEEALVTLGLHATAAHIESIVRAYRGVLSREEETAAAVARRANRYHGFDWDDDDSLKGTYRLPPEDAAVFMAGVDAAAEQVRKSNPDVGYGASFADALVVMAESFLANGPAARTSGDRYQVVLSIDGDVLAFDTDGECALHNGPALAPETVRRLSCDASAVLMVRGPTGEVLDVGRKTRTIPRAIRRALRTRDKTCRWPGCDEARYLDGHHGIHWSHLGPTKLTNLVHLCWHHHFLVHEGGWTLEIRPDGSLHICDPNGQTLGERPAYVIGADEPGLPSATTSEASRSTT